jgi:cytidylate kinase
MPFGAPQHEQLAAMTVIAMTREIGSHGSDVAVGVAAQLGLEIINSEIVMPDVAEGLGVEQGVVQRYLDGKASLFDRWQVDTRKLSRYTLDQVLNLAMKGNVLIRGWGAAALFQGIRGILCVRVCAPMPERVRVMMERLGMQDGEATRREIERFDAANSRAMRASFNFDWNDPLLYHVVLNSARVSVDACVGAVCELALAQEQQYQDDTATKTALADKLLETRVRATLVEHIGSGEMAVITLSAANGKIILEGTTSDGALPARAAKLAREIDGVKVVDNRIVSVPSHGRF